MRFSSPASDVSRFECRLDVPGAVFETCASPKAFAGLASGTYTVLVRAIDAAGNVGTPAQDQFTIPAPPSSGGGGGGGTTNPTPPDDPGPVVQPDVTAPVVKVLTKRARASEDGLVVLRVSCPTDEVRCRVTVRLKHGRKRSPAKTVTVLGGKQVKVRLRLSVATRMLLLERQTLKVTALVTARDAAGNSAPTNSRLTLRAPAT